VCPRKGSREGKPAGATLSDLCASFPLSKKSFKINNNEVLSKKPLVVYKKEKFMWQKKYFLLHKTLKSVAQLQAVNSNVPLTR